MSSILPLIASPPVSSDRFFDILYKVLSYQIPLGETRLSILGILVVLLMQVGFFIISAIVRRVLKERILPRFKVDRAAEFTILKITHYVIIIVGLFTCLGTLGVNLSSLAFFAGMLSVGIGFGLQNIVQNFISGVILLIEHPIKVGDWVNVGGLEGEVKEINLRSTGIETNDFTYIIVPNQDLIQSQVTNASLGEPYVRVGIDVGVSYSSDLRQVHDLLIAEAGKHPDVLKDPAPIAAVVSFGESSVDFKLFVFISHPRVREKVKSEILWGVWWTLRDAGIEIPFPQRDMNVKLPPEGAIPIRLLRPTGTSGT